MAVGFIFCHGWGMTPEFWKNLLPFFQDYPCIVWDLGYFGEVQQDISADDNIQWIGVGHSLGLAKLLTSHVPLMGLIGIQSFLRFCAHEENQSGTPIRVLKKMEQAMLRDPRRVLKSFYQQCGVEEFVVCENINSEKLLSDLALLKAMDFKEMFSAATIPAYFLATTIDPIVARELSLELRDVFEGAKIDFYDGEHHGLGYYCAAECARDIHDSVRTLELK